MAIAVTWSSVLAQAAPDGAGLYREHCAVCHAENRFGAMGPALLPSNLERLRRPAAAEVIANGRLATQMPPFAGKLTREDVNAIVDLLYSAPNAPPVWSINDIRSSRVEYLRAEPLAKPRHAADPLNLFVVVEAGDHHVSIVDGNRFERIARFPSRFALHGGPKFSPDGRFVYLASRDGWITKVDLWDLKVLSEGRARDQLAGIRGV